jgi:hypothetical protein
MGAKETGFRSNVRTKIRLQAYQIAAGLPENPHLALRILDATRQLISDGMAGEDVETVAENVVSLVRPRGA